MLSLLGVAGGRTMSGLVRALLDELGPDDLDRLAELLAPRLAGRLVVSEPASPWLNAGQAAEHLACSRGRLYDLVQLGRLEPRRDGRRLLFAAPILMPT